MNRGQVKRLRKEFDRLKSGGKEWDALRLLERENAIDEFRSVWDELWREQTRHAVRTAELMDQFLQRITEFSTVPDTPDIRFMRTVGDYLSGMEITSVINNMTGLSAPVEVLRREILRQGNENKQLDDAKLRKLLTSFALTPEKITQKDYRNLRDLLVPYPDISEKVFETLEDILARSRKLNNSSTVEFKAHGVYEPNLRAIDKDLSRAASELPLPLSRVVVVPVLANVSAAIRRVAENNADKAARLALAAPFCMERLADSGWSELCKKFQLETGQTFSAVDLDGLRKTARNVTFEESFLLVGKLLKIISSRQDLDEDLQEILIILSKGIFKELTVRRTKISDRDQRKLALVMGQFISKNLKFLYDSMEDLPFLLDSAAAAGCLDPVSALLHVFFAVMARDRNMIANARGMLKLLPLIQDNDVQDLFGQYQEYLAEDMKSLKGMLDICRECGHDLDLPVARTIGLELHSRLIISTLMGGGGRNSFMSMILGPMSDELSQIYKKMIKGIECFSGNPLFYASVALARSFPSGRITGKEFGRYLEKQIEINPSVEQVIADFILILETIRQVSGKQRMDIPFGDMLNGDSLIKELLGAALDVLCGSKEQVMRHSTTSLTALVNLMLQYGDSRGLERYMLIISNAAAERGVSGDEAAGKLYENTTDYIVKATKPDKKKGRRR